MGPMHCNRDTTEWCVRVCIPVAVLPPSLCLTLHKPLPFTKGTKAMHFSVCIRTVCLAGHNQLPFTKGTKALPQHALALRTPENKVRLTLRTPTRETRQGAFDVTHNVMSDGPWTGTFHKRHKGFTSTCVSVTHTGEQEQGASNVTHTDTRETRQGAFDVTHNVMSDGPWTVTFHKRHKGSRLTWRVPCVSGTLRPLSFTKDTKALP